MPTLAPGPSSHTHPPPMPPTLPSQHGPMGYPYPPPHAGGPMMQQPPPTYPAPFPQTSPYGAPVGIPGAAERQLNGSSATPTITNSYIGRETDSAREGHSALEGRAGPGGGSAQGRAAGSTGEDATAARSASNAAAPSITGLANGERRNISSSSVENANADHEVQARNDRDHGRGPGGAGAAENSGNTRDHQ